MADSSAASSGITSSETVDLIGDTGPGPDPAGSRPPAAEQAAAAAAAAPPEASEGWAEEKLRDLMRAVGDGAHAVAGVGEQDWVFIEADLDRIAPPLTRILNRVPVLQKAAEASDPIAVGLGFGLYGWRSALERSAVLAQQPGPAPRAAPPPPPPAAMGSNGNGPAVPDGYLTNADRLRATRPTEE